MNDLATPDASSPAPDPSVALDPSEASMPPRRAWWRRASVHRALVHLLFWSWHAVWAMGVLFGVAPRVLPDLLADSVQGRVPWGITLSALLLTVMPVFTALAGWRLRHDHRRLFRLFYGVGGVAFTLLFVRLFFIRQATPGVHLLLGTLALGAAFYTAELFGGLPRVGRAAAVVRMVGYSALLVIGLYAGLMMGLYTVPGTLLAVPGVFEMLVEVVTRGQVLKLLAYSPFLFVFGLFVLYSFTLLMGLPVAVAVLYTGGYWRGLRAFGAEHSRGLGVAITAATVAAWGLAFGALTQQPQREAFAQLASPPADLPAQRERLADSASIREGLLNAYLAPHRYWGATGRSGDLAEMYRLAFHTDHDVMGPQRLFDALAAPLLYDGDDMRTERIAAEIRYEQFFDRPLQEGERASVLEAVSATYDRGEAQAGLLDVGQRKVLLQQQALSMETHGDLARFTLHETYVNQTWEQQEIFYAFSLPEHAAVTGLWLGEVTEDGELRRFPYAVSPRGAAQQVYREQRAQRVDPALIEQVGPRQVRLRAFPIPPRTRRDDDGAAPLHLWLEWTVLADDAGWPLPRLAEARNVYWEPELTERTIDGAPAAHRDWLPARLDDAAGSRASEPRAHAIRLGDMRVRATPVPAAHAEPLRGRLAVVLETSRSMGAHADEVEEILASLERSAAEVDLVLAPSPWSAQSPQRVALGDVQPHYYGGHTLAGVLAQFEALRGDARYDAVVVLSDEGSFAFLQDDAQRSPRATLGMAPDAQAQLDRAIERLAEDAATVAGARADAPVWLLHLGGLPHAYRDEVGDLLQRSRGGVVTRLDQLAARLAGTSIDGYRWTFEPTALTEAAAADEHEGTDESTDDPFAPLAARALVAHLAAEMDEPTVEQLDRIHAVAVRSHVVTPWSSMIVLVNDAQREALRRAELADDRFDREAESGIEDTTTPGAALELAATPEPEEWLLLALVALAVVIRLRSTPRPTCAAA